MNILRIIKELYTGKDNLVAQITIFALVGIMAIAFNEVISLFTGNTLYAVFSVPSYAEVIIFSMLGIMIFIFFTGYIYKFVHENYTSEIAFLPSISMNCFTTFIKVFPVMFVWGIYFGIAGLLGTTFLKADRIEFYIYWAFLMILLPFINIIFVKFVKNYTYNAEIFNPIYVVKIIRKVFIKVILYLLQFILLGFVISVLSSLCFKFGVTGQTRVVELIIILTTLCISSYLQQVLNLAYYRGLTEIIKKNGV